MINKKAESEMENLSTKLTKISRSSLEKENLLDFEAEKVEMSLNTESSLASGLLIQRLTELYEDPIVASVRETVSNALDALVKSSNIGGSIWIESPSKFNPLFVVKDNGVGMSYEDLKNVYAKYGASTKIDNFNQLGAYGLGAKAPLAYGTEFTVTSVKNGEKTTVMVIREELTNYIKIIDRSKTTESSGTTVSIPVSQSDVDKFAYQAEKYGSYPLGNEDISIYLNGKKNNGDDYLCIGDNLVIHQDGEEKIYGKVWIKNDIDNITQLMNKFWMKSNYNYEIDKLEEVDFEEFGNHIRYLVGGWVYDMPITKKSRFKSKNKIIVEIKPGILGFNSSRDAILSNERYEVLENLVREGLCSKEFRAQVIESIKGFSNEKFKDTMLNLTIKKFNELSMYGQSSSYFENVFNEVSIRRTNGKIEFSSKELAESPLLLKNKEGYSLEKLFSDIPKEDDGKTFTLSISRDSYSSSNKISSFKFSGYGRFSLAFSFDTISEAKEKYEDVMIKSSDKDQSLDILMLKTIENLQDNHNKHFALFITEIDEKKAASMFSKRKAILDIVSEDITSNNVYSAYITFTTHSKKDIEKMLNTADLKDRLKVITVSEAEDLMKERNRILRKSKSSAEETSFYLYEEDNIKDLSLNQVKELSKKDSSIHFLTVSKNSKTISKNSYERMRNWIVNSRQDEKAILIISKGENRKIDLEPISDLGEFYYKDKLAGNTEFYKNLINGKEIKMDLFLDTSKHLRETAFMSFMLKILNTSYLNQAYNKLENKIGVFKSLCEVADVNYDEIDLSEIKKASEKSKVEATYEMNSSIKTLAKYLLPEDKIFLEKLSAVIGKVPYGYSEFLSFNDVGEVTIENRYSFQQSIENYPIKEVQLLFKSKDTISTSMAKSQVKEFLEVFKENISTINNIKF